MKSMEHGRWIVTKERNFLRNTCPRCGGYIDSDDSCIVDTHRYCPFCGLPMDAENGSRQEEINRGE